uniref:ADAM metallopeptidase domain 9a n=1 Tax=Kryptolebias marmoratus TaxID=37003 RepID=A0A3Q3BI85_KRYMA
GEDCDCGSEKDPCCEYQMCKLKSGAQCAYGECCYNCQVRTRGTVCRSDRFGNCGYQYYGYKKCESR